MRRGPDLAPVPEDQAPPSIGEQLAQALSETGVSQRQLAQRLAGTDNVKKIEAKRRWLAKINEGIIKRPGMAAVERALSLPRGYFRFPTPVQIQRQQDRQEELEARLAEVARVQMLLLDELALVVDEQGRLASRPSQDRGPLPPKKGAGR